MITSATTEPVISSACFVPLHGPPVQVIDLARTTPLAKE